MKLTFLGILILLSVLLMMGALHYFKEIESAYINKKSLMNVG